jgi:hypothetical protein
MLIYTQAISSLRTPGIVAILILSGCAARHTASQTWRLTNSILIPPEVAGPEVARRTFTVAVEAGGGTCPPVLRVHGKHLQITVSREMLLRKPNGWLAAWSEQMEASKCIAQGEGPKLAEAVAGSLPLDPDLVFKLLYATDRQSGQVDLGPGIRLQVVSPIMEDGKNFSPPVPVQVSGSGNTLNLALAVPAMLGYETALYDILPAQGRPGFMIVPLGAERHIGGSTNHVSQPATNYFQFSPQTAWYRLYYKAGETDFTALIVGARSRAELSASITSCEGQPAGMCVQIPRHVAVNPMITVNVNGSEVQLNWGSTLGGAIRAAGERQPNLVLPRLSLSKPHTGRLVAVDFDRSDPKVLDLVMTGGESISWTGSAAQ